MILGGDIGGTKVLLGIEDPENPDRLLQERRYVCAEFTDFDAILDTYFRDSGVAPPTIRRSCLALAGPVADDGRHAKLTNLPWTIASDALAQRFGMPSPRLVNDFVAAAMGAVTSAAAQRVTLQAGTPLGLAPCVVVGAGTGLGMALALPHESGWRIVPSEGGHLAFAPSDEEQVRLWRFLAARHRRVTWERVVSGPGLAAIYEFISGQRLAPEVVAQRALDGRDGQAQRALDLFLAAYGAYAGDMAMTCLARGGVFLAGGIAAKILPALQRSDFLKTFGDKAEHAHLLAEMPLHVAIDPSLGLKGALRLA